MVSILKGHKPIRGDTKSASHKAALTGLSGFFSMAGVGNHFTEKHPCFVNRVDSPNASLQFMAPGSTVYDGVPNLERPPQFFPPEGVKFERIFNHLPAEFKESIKYYQVCEADPISLLNSLQQEIHDQLRVIRTVKLTVGHPSISFHTLEASGRCQFGKSPSKDELCDAVYEEFGASWRDHVQAQLPPANELPKARNRRFAGFNCFGYIV